MSTESFFRYAPLLIEIEGRRLPALSRAGPASAVGDNAEEPGAQRRPAFETIDPAHHTEPRLLYDLLGDRPARYERRCEPQHRGVKLIDERHECRFVACPEPSNELGVIIHAVSLGDQGPSGPRQSGETRARAAPGKADSWWLPLLGRDQPDG